VGEADADMRASLSHLFVVVTLVTFVGCKGDGGDEAADSAAATDSTATDSGTDDHADHHGTETDGTDPAEVYCACMLDNCHEPYHTKWGEDEVAAQAACVAEADALPINGSDVEAGNFIECRQHWCEMAASDPNVCTNAIGDAVCI